MEEHHRIFTENDDTACKLQHRLGVTVGVRHAFSAGVGSRTSPSPPNALSVEPTQPLTGLQC